MEPVRLDFYRTQRLLSYLLCVLVLLSSFDRVPDPPSTQPQHSTATSLSFGTHHVWAVDQDRATGPVSWGAASPRGLLHGTLLSSDTLLLTFPIYLRSVSDSSPPNSAPSRL